MRPNKFREITSQQVETSAKVWQNILTIRWTWREPCWNFQIRNFSVSRQMQVTPFKEFDHMEQQAAQRVLFISGIRLHMSRESKHLRSAVWMAASTFCTAVTRMLPFFQISASSLSQFITYWGVAAYAEAPPQTPPQLWPTHSHRAYAQGKWGNFFSSSQNLSVAPLWIPLGSQGTGWGSCAYSPFSLPTPSFWYLETHPHPSLSLNFLNTDENINLFPQTYFLNSVTE